MVFAASLTTLLRALRVPSDKWNLSPSRAPSKKPVQKPAHIPTDPILPIAPAEQPVTMPVLILHPEVIAHRPGFTVALPPLPRDTFRPIRAPHPVPHPPPGERHRRVI